MPKATLIKAFRLRFDSNFKFHYPVWLLLQYYAADRGRLSEGLDLTGEGCRATRSPFPVSLRVPSSHREGRRGVADSRRPPRKLARINRSTCDEQRFTNFRCGGTYVSACGPELSRLRTRMKRRCQLSSTSTAKRPKGFERAL